jgi:hypothetical protein
VLKNGGHPSQIKAHLEFLFLRFLDDYYYQARERTLAWLEDMPSIGLPSSWEFIADSTSPQHWMTVSNPDYRRLQASWSKSSSAQAW